MSRIDCPEVKNIVAAVQSKGYRVFKNPSGHDLNIVGIRNKGSRANRFDDWLTVFYWYDEVWNLFAFPATTDPGIFYRQNPLNVRGTAIMKPGQYRHAYKVGRHSGYKALQQVGAITVFRDDNMDDELNVDGVEEHSGLHAINIHRASRQRASTQVDKWSAGCQVMQDPDHFDFFMTICDRGALKFGNDFTYTLLDSDDF
jgi:hypothetical protein